ncbi:OprO/OprP family phosphate-selective porin [Luteimonas sp. R10]|uniref:OprO/OprP family phosphate-selective porin n=1 Tax=Luteimonas sp. R10 TaxID=3108176 RepID=UPI00308BA3FA|nr:porin [Luteimonas sp. R10]
MTSLLTLGIAASMLSGTALAAGDAGTPGVRAWPPAASFADGAELSATGNLAYDHNGFSGDDDGAAAAFDDAHDWRRKELGLVLKRKGIYELGAGFDFASRTWMDVGIKLDTSAFAGRDLGRLRLGQSKVPLGLEGNTATRNTAFLENSLPTQAFYQGRRIGLDWTLDRPHAVFNAGYYHGDLQGNNAGRTVAVRGAWVPLREAGRVLHLGASATREVPDARTGEDGARVPASVRWRAKPEAALTSVRLVDSGTLAGVDAIDRQGLELLWIGGPWSLQGEYLRQSTSREEALPSYSTGGYYVFASWMVTGESRGYSGGGASNPKPTGRLGALELLARYSSLDLDAGDIAGGSQRNRTLGANWYFARHFKVQVNYVDVKAERGTSTADPDIVEMRTQFSF